MRGKAHRWDVEPVREKHTAVSVDIDRLNDAALRRFLPIFSAAGYPAADLTGQGAGDVAEMRARCAAARAAGLQVFPPCDHVDARGYCLGHWPSAERDTFGT